MKPLLPSEAPQTPEQWTDIMADIERVIMPGVSDFFKCPRDDRKITDLRITVMLTDTHREMKCND